jgi:predicted nuclease with TOPRIM domain
MVRIKEINEKDLLTMEGFCRLFIEKKDAYKLRLLAKKYKIRRVAFFKKLLEFFESYYDILESKHFSLQKFLDERKELEDLHKNKVQAMADEYKALEENYKKVIAELNEYREQYTKLIVDMYEAKKDGSQLPEEKGNIR